MPATPIDDETEGSWMRLTHYKCPTEVRFLDELPRLPTGKLLKRALVGPGI
jgi:acyl-CoA synthetase (AMP-forming)/AMP-acid ligase II